MKTLLGRIFPSPDEPAAEEHREQPAAFPAVEEIEQAVRDYRHGSELTRQGEALKRKAKKVLERVPDGPYGAATVRRNANSPITDKGAMELRLKALGEELPIMQRAATLVVELTEAPGISTAEIPAASPAAESRDWSMADLLADLDSRLANA